jgi:hypothetical protein
MTGHQEMALVVTSDGKWCVGRVEEWMFYAGTHLGWWVGG